MSVGLARLIIFFVWVGLCLPSHAVSGRSLLQSMGVEPLSQQPVDFELPTTDGKSARLSDSKGKWIWLVFWATWCGPCEYELPKLSALQKRFPELKILAVSVDEAPTSEVREYLKERKIQLTTFHDQTGKVSGPKYQASAIPTLYMISPDWKLVGLFRGAQDWDTPHIHAQLEDLLKFKSWDEQTQVADSVVLPDNLKPPSIELISGERNHNGIPFKVKVSWAGSSKAYLIKPPKITLPEGVKSTALASYSSAGESASLIYSTDLSFPGPGDYLIGPVELAYRARLGGDKELFSRATAVSVTIPKTDRTVWFVVGTLLLLALAACFGVYGLRKKRNFASPQPLKTSKKELWAEVRQRKAKLGERAYAVELMRVAQTVFDEDANKISELIEKLRFGGAVLGPAELASWEKKIEQRVEHGS